MSPRPVANPYMRVSDAERGEVADALKRHCADGRLDSAEFEARIDRTLRSKTRADLEGLLDDLPDLNPGRAAARRPDGYEPRRPSAPVAHRPLWWTVLIVGVVFMAAISTISVIADATRPHVTWPLFLLVALLIWGRGHQHRRWRA